MNFTRAQWATSTPSWTAMPGPQPDVFIHHVGGACPVSPTVGWLRTFEANALAAGAARGDRYIAVEYHVGVFQDGSLVQYRPDGVQGGATAGHNSNSYAVVAMGNFENDRPSPQLIAAIRRQIDTWKHTGRLVPQPNIRPHNSVFATACPGRNLLAVMDQLRVVGATNTEDDMGWSQWEPLEQIAMLDAVYKTVNAALNGEPFLPNGQPDPRAEVVKTSGLFAQHNNLEKPGSLHTIAVWLTKSIIPKLDVAPAGTVDVAELASQLAALLPKADAEALVKAIGDKLAA